MSGAQYLRQLLSPLGVYDLEGPFQNGELEALGAALDQAEDALDELHRESCLATARDWGLERTAALFRRRPVAATPKAMREALAALLRIGGDSFTLDAINDTISGCGVNALVRETGEAGTVEVSFPKVPGIPPGFDEIQKIVEDILYGDNVIEKHGINRDSTGDREKTRYLCGKQGIFTRDRALIRPGFIRQLETRASTRSASFFHALGSPGRPHNGGGEAGAYRTRNGAKPLKQGHLRAKRGPLGPSRKSQQQTKRTGFAAHGHSIAETAPEGKRASCANGALIRA